MQLVGDTCVIIILLMRLKLLIFAVLLTLIWLSGFTIVSEAKIILRKPTPIKVRASADYATDIFANPWNMADPADIWSNYGNVAGVSYGGGKFQAITTSSDPQIYLLWPGYGGSLATPRDGITHPISTNKYKTVVFRMYSSADGKGQLYWFYSQSTANNYNFFDFNVKRGWHIYKLSNSVQWRQKWQGNPIGLRVDPINKPGAKFAIDWFRATNVNKKAKTFLKWKNTRPNKLKYRLYIDDNKKGRNGLLLGYALPKASGKHIRIPYLSPGKYYIYARKVLGSNRSEYSNYVPVRINTPPVINILQPNAAGGQDWASAKLGDAWDMNNAEDVSIMANLSQPSFSGGIFSAININPASGLVSNDPIFYLNLRGQKLDAKKYHRLSIVYRYDDAFSLKRGTMARFAWVNYPSQGWQQTNDILTYNGWNTLTYDLSKASLDVGTYGWRDLISTLRFDPHEDPGLRRFYIDSVKIAADDTLQNGAYLIKFKTKDTDNSTLHLKLLADPDTKRNNGNERLILNKKIKRNSKTFYWKPDKTFNKIYYIYAVISDGLNKTTSYSSGPVTTKRQ